MKLNKIKEVEVKDLEIEIKIYPSKSKYTVEYNYTCPQCAGYGCNTHVHSNNDCNNGSVYEDLDLANLDKIFPEAEATEVKRIIGELKSKTSPKFVGHTKRGPAPV